MNVVKGMKVVCVDDSIQAHKLNEIVRDIPHFVKRGQIYTIRDVNDFGSFVAVTVEELYNPEIVFKFPMGSQLMEPGFGLHRFEPFIEPAKVEQEVSPEKPVLFYMIVPAKEYAA